MTEPPMTPDIPKRSILRSWNKEDLSPAELRDRDIDGGFPQEVFALLKSDPELAIEAAQLIMDGHFPPSLHDDILEAAGFSSDVSLGQFPTLVREPAERRRMIIFRRPRRLRFRREVLQAYDERFRSASQPSPMQSLSAGRPRSSSCGRTPARNVSQ